MKTVNILEMCVALQLKMYYHPPTFHKTEYSDKQNNNFESYLTRMSKTVSSTKQRHNLGAFQNKILCKIFGHKKDGVKS